MAIPGVTEGKDGTLMVRPDLLGHFGLDHPTFQGPPAGLWVPLLTLAPNAVTTPEGTVNVIDEGPVPDTPLGGMRWGLMNSGTQTTSQAVIMTGLVVGVPLVTRI